MILPVLLPECRVKAQQFCASCRDRERGRGFRRSILKIRGVEAGEDFECPKGKPWADDQQRQQLAAARLNICQAGSDGEPCPAYKSASDRVLGVKCRDCGCGNLSLVSGVCPRGLWNLEQRGV